MHKIWIRDDIQLKWLRKVQMLDFSKQNFEENKKLTATKATATINLYFTEKSFRDLLYSFKSLNIIVLTFKMMNSCSSTSTTTKKMMKKIIWKTMKISYLCVFWARIYRPYTHTTVYTHTKQWYVPTKAIIFLVCREQSKLQFTCKLCRQNSGVELLFCNCCRVFWCGKYAKQQQQQQQPVIY